MNIDDVWGAPGGKTAPKKAKKKPAKKNKVKKKPAAKQPTEPDHADPLPPPENPEITDLIEHARKAKLMEPIQKSEMMKFRIEKEKLALLKSAGEVAEISFMEFLYLGYIEKVNIDMVGMLKKLRPQLTNLIKERDEGAVIELFKNEIRAILTEVKKSQSKDVKRWRREL